MKKVLVLSAMSLLCFGPSAAMADFPFGIPGYDGNSGAYGYSGTPGCDLVVTANGSSMSLDLHGTNGGPGGNGMDGSPASSCYQPGRVAENVYGARGGNGGNGGNGGDGGNGGSLTVYYQNPADLQKLFVNDHPGYGGPGGQGGMGYSACTCSYYRWEIRQEPDCHREGGDGGRRMLADNDDKGRGDDHRPGDHGGDHDRDHGGDHDHDHDGDGGGHIVCYPRPPLEFYCQDGSPGRPGTSGYPGTNGSYGLFRIVHSATVLTNPQPTANVSLRELPATMTLSEDLWTTKSGTQQLFAPGSDVPGTYQEYAGRKFTRVSVAWNARESVQRFQTDSLSLSVSNGVVTATPVGSDIWAAIGVSYDNDGAATVAVNKAIQPVEATQLTGQISGVDQAVTVTLTDGAKVSDVVNTRVHAKVVSQGVFGHVRYDGDVPANLMTATDSTITIQVGQLQGIPSGDLKQGKKLKVELTITRSLGNGSATQSLEMQTKLGS